MIEEAFYWGIKPSEMPELSLPGAVSYIEQQRKHERDLLKTLAQIGYSAGVLGSMALAKRMPSFDEVFDFSEEPLPRDQALDRSKAEMLALAENLNRQVQGGGEKI